MPIYEYQCAACGRVVEKFQKISENPLTECSACGGSLTKLISSCSFQLKGSGWYVTDYSGKMQSANMAGTSGDAGAGNKEGGDGAKAATDTAAPAKIK